jgi:hypothetical protein
MRKRLIAASKAFFWLGDRCHDGGDWCVRQVKRQARGDAMTRRDRIILRATHGVVVLTALGCVLGLLWLAGLA